MGNIKFNLLFMILVTFANTSWSNSVVLFEEGNELGYSSEGIHYIPSKDGSSADILKIKAPDEYGVSINHIESLTVDTSPLKIVNVPQLSGDEKIPAADLIVIMAEHFDFRNVVDFVGPVSDVLILVPTFGQSVDSLSCYSCEFNNVGKLTLAAAEPIFRNHVTLGDISYFASYPTDLATLNEITTLRARSYFSSNLLNYGGKRTGRVSVRGLNVPGAISVEIFALDPQISGTITSNTRVNRVLGGGLEQDINGDYSMGMGSFNVLSGYVVYDYATKTVVAVTDPDSLHMDRGVTTSTTVSGDIQFPSIEINSAAPLTVSAEFVTNTDYLSTIRYQGETIVTDESVVIQTLHEKNQIDLTASFASASEISIKSAGSLIFPEDYVLNAPRINLIAKNQLINKGKIEADYLNIAAGSIVNRGSFNAWEKTEVWAEMNIVNEFGGVIASDQVIIESQSGLVRNGSRVTKVKSDQELLTTEDELISGLSVTANNDVEASSYRASWGREEWYSQRSEGELPVKTFAHILGNEINITATALENVNPYWKHIEENGDFLLDPRLVSQVSISAEDQLLVSTTDYVVNNSAIMKVNSELGVLDIVTNSLVNERYRSEAFLAAGPDANLVDLYGMRLVTYSPAGLIMSMGDFQLSGDAFLNNNAYFEVFGNAHLGVDRTRHIGIELPLLLRQHTTDSLYLSYCGDLDDVSLKFVGSCDAEGHHFFETSTNHMVQLVSPKELDALFFVHGDLYGQEGSLYIKNNKPFEELLSDVHIDVFSDIHSAAYDQRQYSDSQFTVDVDQEGGIYTATWEEKRTVCENTPKSNLKTCSTQTRSGSLVDEIWDRLEQLVEWGQNKLESLWNDVSNDWWN